MGEVAARIADQIRGEVTGLESELSKIDRQLSDLPTGKEPGRWTGGCGNPRPKNPPRRLGIPGVLLVSLSR
jgi:hypothetical protein